ncbi:unnamed protein product [Cochlearia groenlandica]
MGEPNNYRLKLPMSIRCNTCGSNINNGTNLNSRREHVVGEKYLGIQVFRFYLRCIMCPAMLSLKTDPRNSGYIVESGASRAHEPWGAVEEDHGDEEEGMNVG